MYKWWARDDASLEQLAHSVVTFHHSVGHGAWSPEKTQAATEAIFKTANALQLIAENPNAPNFERQSVALFQRPFALRTAVLFARYNKGRFGGAISPAELQTTANQMKRLHAIKEPASLVQIPKSEGSFRTTWEFGIQRTGQQYLMSWLLQAATQTSAIDFSLPGRGGTHAAAIAILEGLEDDYRFWVTTDVISAYPSITKGHIRPLASFGKRLERYVMFPRLSPYYPYKEGAHANEPACCELPQGAAHSPFVLSAVIDGCLRSSLPSEVVAVVYADNIAIGARTPKRARCAFFAIQDAFASLSRGLDLHTPKICDGYQTPDPEGGNIHDGFEQFNSIDFCGYRLGLDKFTGKRRVRPSGKARNRFWDRVQSKIIDGDASTEEKSTQIDIAFEHWSGSFKLWKPNAYSLDIYETMKTMKLYGHPEG